MEICRERIEGINISEQVRQIRRYVKDYRHPFHEQGVEIYGTDKVLERAANTIEALSAKLDAAIAEQPTAYDVDKIVERIKSSSTDEDGIVCYVDGEPVITKEMAIKIVKSGCIE